MPGGLFREKSLKRISSPEELDSYIKVSNPSVWLTFGAILMLTIGLCVWTIFGRLEQLIPASASVQDGTMSVTVHVEQINQLKNGMEVRVDGDPIGTVSQITPLSDGTYLLEVAGSTLADGIYGAEIVAESLSPLYFIVN